MVNISTKIKTKWTTTSHLNSLNTKKTMTYGIGNPGPGMGQVQNVTGLNWLIGSLHPPFLDN